MKLTSLFSNRLRGQLNNKFKRLKSNIDHLINLLLLLTLLPNRFLNRLPLLLNLRLQRRNKKLLGPNICHNFNIRCLITHLLHLPLNLLRHHLITRRLLLNRLHTRRDKVLLANSSPHNIRDHRPIQQDLQYRRRRAQISAATTMSLTSRLIRHHLIINSALLNTNRFNLLISRHLLHLLPVGNHQIHLLNNDDDLTLRHKRLKLGP